MDTLTIEEWKEVRRLREAGHVSIDIANMMGKPLKDVNYAYCTPSYAYYLREYHVRRPRRYVRRNQVEDDTEDEVESDEL